MFMILGLEFPIVKLVELFEKDLWKLLHPSPVLFVHIGFKDLRQFIFGTLGLVPGGLVNQRNDTDTGQTSNEYFSMLGR